MNINLATLPDDTQALKALVHALVGEVKAKSLKIAQLEARTAKLKRLQFGQSSEKLAREIEQLELELDELHEDEGVLAAESPAAVQAILKKPARRPLPEHLPREEEVHEPSCTRPNCGGQMVRLGEDVTEVLEYVPASFKSLPQRKSRGDPPCQAKTLLPGVRDHRAGTDAVTSHRARASRSRIAGPCAGGQIR